MHACSVLKFLSRYSSKFSIYAWIKEASKFVNNLDFVSNCQYILVEQSINIGLTCAFGEFRVFAMSWK